MSAQQTLVPALDVSECYICNEPFDTWTGSGAIESRFVLGCGHTFASACVQRWVNENSSCPMCRKDPYLEPVAHVTTQGSNVPGNAPQQFEPFLDTLEDSTLQLRVQKGRFSNGTMIFSVDCFTALDPVRAVDAMIFKVITTRNSVFDVASLFGYYHEEMMSNAWLEVENQLELDRQRHANLDPSENPFTILLSELWKARGAFISDLKKDLVAKLRHSIKAAIIQTDRLDVTFDKRYKIAYSLLEGFIPRYGSFDFDLIIREAKTVVAPLLTRLGVAQSHLSQRSANEPLEIERAYLVATRGLAALDRRNHIYRIPYPKLTLLSSKRNPTMAMLQLTLAPREFQNSATHRSAVVRETRSSRAANLNREALIPFGRQEEIRLNIDTTNTMPHRNSSVPTRAVRAFPYHEDIDRIFWRLGAIRAHGRLRIDDTPEADAAEDRFRNSLRAIENTVSIMEDTAPDEFRIDSNAGSPI